MACLQRARGLIDHATGTTAKLDETRMEESTAMERSQLAMGLIDHVMRDANAIFGGNGEGGGWSSRE